MNCVQFTICIDSPYDDGAHPGCHDGCPACWRAFTGSRPRLRELEAFDLGLNEHDGAEVVLGLTARECAGRVFSNDTNEWLYVFKPRILGTALYVKLVLRADCVVVSFHKEQENEDED